MNVRKKNPAGILLTVMLLAALLTICLELGLSYLRPDTPGSIPKHLIHFAIMLALLGSAVLLCLFCPPFKKLWTWIDEHILSKETRPIAIDIIYAVIAGLMLLHHFYVILYYPTIPTGATKFTPLWIVFAAFTIILNQSWHEFIFHGAAVFFVYTFERFFIKNTIITGNNIVYFSSAIYALFVCLFVLPILRPRLRKTFLQALCAIWAISTFIMSIAGLYVIWTGFCPQNLVGTQILVMRGRLWVFSASTVTAGYLACGIVMDLIGFSISKRKTTKCLYLLLCLITMIANSLTDSRSSFFMLSFLIAGMICLGIWTRYRNQNAMTFTGKKTASLIFVLTICFGVCFFLVIKSQSLLGFSFINLRNNGVVIVSTAKAENPIDVDMSQSEDDPKQPWIYQRDVWVSEESDINETLNGRYDIWQKGMQYIQDHPYILIDGVTVDGSVAPIIEREDHSHNILLQTLLEGGIPALLLYLSLIFYGVFHAFRLWNRKGIPFWQRLLPLPVFSILLWEMAECLTHFSYGHPPMTLFWFFLGATITVSKSLGKAPKATEQPAIPAESAVTETGE